MTPTEKRDIKKMLNKWQTSLRKDENFYSVESGDLKTLEVRIITPESNRVEKIDRV